MEYLSEDQRQLLLKLIDQRLPQLSGRVGGSEYFALVAVRRKIEGVDKRVAVETVAQSPKA